MGGHLLDQSLPRDTDVSIDERLAGHSVALVYLLITQVFTFFRLDSVDVLLTLFDTTFARSA